MRTSGSGNASTNKRMMASGFMCRSPSSTAVCMTGDHRSVIVPRRHVRSSSSTLVDQSMLMKSNTNYTTLVGDYRRPAVVTLSSALTRDKKQHGREREQCDQIVSRQPRPPVPFLPSSDHVFQVVVLRVSLHCQGCTGRVKKHLSKMEGMTSFSIDLETKRVTGMGHVSPVVVLESVSKVKKADLWPC